MTTSAFRVNAQGLLMVNEPNLDRDPPNPSTYTFQVRPDPDLDSCALTRAWVDFITSHNLSVKERENHTPRSLSCFTAFQIVMQHYDDIHVTT